MLEIAANKLLMQDYIESDHPTLVSRAWAKRWLDRHSEFQKVKRKPLAAVRKNAEDSKVIQSLFDEFKKTVREHGICEEDT